MDCPSHYDNQVLIEYTIRIADWGAVGPIFTTYPTTDYHQSENTYHTHPSTKRSSENTNISIHFVTLLTSPTSSRNAAISSSSSNSTSSKAAAAHRQPMSCLQLLPLQLLSIAPSWRHSDHPSVRRDHVDKRNLSRPARPARQSHRRWTIELWH